MVKRKVIIISLVFLITILGYQSMNTLHVQAVSNISKTHKIKKERVFGPHQIEKEKYLTLVFKKANKALFSDFINERNQKFDIQIESLEENNVLNIPAKIKQFLVAKKTTWDFKWLVLFEDIKYGNIVIDNGDNEFVKVMTDAFYWNLDDDPEYIPECIVGRVTRFFLSVKKWQEFNEFYSGIAFPFTNYPHSTYCPGCIVNAVDGSVVGQEKVKFASSLGYNSITLYETRSTLQPKFQPDYCLNPSNYLKALSKCALWSSFSTSEPYYAYKNWQSSVYKTPTTAIWQDKDENGKVEDKYNTEIEVEELCNFQNPDNFKRVAIVGMSDNSGFMNTANFFYNTVLRIDPLDINFDSSSVYESFLQGYSVGESVIRCFKIFRETYPGARLANAQYASLNLVAFGPPETTIDDLISSPKISIAPVEIEMTSEIVVPLNSYEITFQIRNIGSADLYFTIEYDKSIIIIQPEQGIIVPSNQQIISVKIKIPTRLYGIQPYSTPKQKFSRIRIISNDLLTPQKELVVKWTGV